MTENNSKVVQKEKPKLAKKARSGTRVVSQDYTMDGWHASKSEVIWYMGKIYLYIIPDALTRADLTSNKKF